MNFLIASTFTDSLHKLTNDEQKAVKITVFDLQQDLNHPGLRWHKLEKSKDPRFASISANMDIRLIVHQSDNHLLICYVGHHDKAYRWAANRKIQTHPKTGAAQLVELRETIKEIVVPRYVDEETMNCEAIAPALYHFDQVIKNAATFDSEATAPPEAPPEVLPLFAQTPEDELLGYGVPVEWLGEVRSATEETLLTLTDFLPQEASEALLELATGGTPQTSVVAGQATVPADPFEHPDAKRRFRVMSNVEELERALDYPWEKWTVFLHPAQREMVQRSYNGPARVSGSAGTGKTIVALHRAVYLARQHHDARMLVTTFSDTLAKALKTKLLRLVGNEPAVFERIDVQAIEAVGQRLYEATFSKPAMADEPTIRGLLAEKSKAVKGHRFTDAFIWTEWREVVDAWQLKTWEAYRDVPRLGRKTRLTEQKRQLLWGMFEQVRTALAKRNLHTKASLFAQVAKHLRERRHGPYAFVVVDEAQDLGVPELRLLAAMGSTPDALPDTLFFTGDLGQRIFQPPFSWKILGLDIRGRSRTLRINYRTSHQIRRQVDRLLPPKLSDVDGNAETRKGTVSVFNGPEPSIMAFDNEQQETQAVAHWLTERQAAGFCPQEIGVFVRSEAQLPRALAAVNTAGMKALNLQNNFETKSDHVSLSTMHMAKGLEFRAVVVMACDDEVIPLQQRIESVVDHSDLEEVYNTERHLLYVACTRARDHLLVTSVQPASEFVADMQL